MDSRLLYRAANLALLVLVPCIAFSDTAPNDVTTAISSVETYVKVVGGTLTAIVTLLGLPIVFLTYKKTRAEIEKIKLESESLRGSKTATALDAQESLSVSIKDSPYANVEVTADPRFLVALLILLEFVFASVVLTLVGYLFSIFSIGGIGTIARGLLAAILLLPIAKQVIETRTLLTSPATPTDALKSQRQTRIAIYAAYAMATLALFFVGTLLLFLESANSIERYLSWIFLFCGVAMSGLFPIVRRNIDRYLSKTD